ncbi:MAG: recombination regulator RecX [Pseudonocardiales bacterium]|nr:MAG: recombination regulator RecX [Pseudonocardiales bacterium]
MTAKAPPVDELDPPGDPEAVARKICLQQLAQRARTRSELAAALQRRGVPAPTARSVLDRFTEVGLIDDGALAASFALAQHRQRGLAARAVAVKLRQRGIAEPAVQTAVGQIDADSEAAAARMLVARRLVSLQDLEPQAQARRLVGLLARRGYPAGLAYQIVRESLGQAVIGESVEIDN